MENSSLIRNIYLLRHTDPQNYRSNMQARCCIGGCTDVSLSNHGQIQAQKLKEYFDNKAIDLIYSSPMKRCIETAKIIANQKKRIVLTEQLREINMGAWEGLTFEEIRDQYQKVYDARGKDILNIAPPGGESFVDCAARVNRAFKSILENSHGNIIIISHAGANRTILSKLSETPLSDLLKIPQEYGCINHLYQDQNGKILVKALNSTCL